MKTKLTEMWAALLAYLPQAIAAGHGESWESWARMCNEKTAEAAYAAAGDAADGDAVWAATAAYFAWADYDDADAATWAQKAIDRITKITVKADHIPDTGVMVANEGSPPMPYWYCVDKSGTATLCADEDDALQNAKMGALDWPNNAPYRAVQLCECQTAPPKREWVGLADDDRLCAKYMLDTPEGLDAVIEYIDFKLKELNHD